MSSAWDDFKEPANDRGKTNLTNSQVNSDIKRDTDTSKEDDYLSCEWGFSGLDSHSVGVNGESSDCSDSSKFIPIYEKYLSEKQSFVQDFQTTNHGIYNGNPSKVLREWFEYEGHEFSMRTEQHQDDEFVCNIDIPLDNQDFTITSELRKKKQIAIDEACLIACKLLDGCHLLFSWQSSTNKEDSTAKRRLIECSKEDDIELDSTRDSAVKRHCLVGVTKVNTYESLMARWTELNKCILSLKAKLVRLNLTISKQDATKSLGRHHSVSSKSDTINKEAIVQDDDEEPDPLEEYMSNLDKKEELSRDEKIEKSRLKSEIVRLEREQEEVSRLVELAKPKFSLEKACPKIKP